MRKCSNCKNRAWFWGSSIDHCMWYEMAATEDEEITQATKCGNYEEGTPECYDEEYYCSSSTAGDYSPSNPWDAPGMSVHDFI